MATDHRQELDGLEKKVRPMEDILCEFKGWMAAIREKLNGLSPIAKDLEQRHNQLLQAEVGPQLNLNFNISYNVWQDIHVHACMF